MGLTETINERLDELQAMMESQKHISDAGLVQEHIGNITKFWRVLSEEDREYVDCARSALEDKLEWRV